MLSWVIEEWNNKDFGFLDSQPSFLEGWECPNNPIHTKSSLPDMHVPFNFLTYNYSQPSFCKLDSVIQEPNITAYENIPLVRRVAIQRSIFLNTNMDMYRHTYAHLY